MPLKRTKRSPAVVMKINLKSYEPDLSQVLESPPSSATSTVLNFDEPNVILAEVASNSPTINEVSISFSPSTNVFTNPSTSSPVIGSTESSSTRHTNSSNSSNLSTSSSSTRHNNSSNSSNLSTSSSEGSTSAEIKCLLRKLIRSPPKEEDLKESKRKREDDETRRKRRRRNAGQPGSSLADPKAYP